MTPSEIINKAICEKRNWRAKGYREGKFIIGYDAKNTLITNLQYASDGTITDNTLLGHPYVVDFKNKNDINFCPID